MFRTAALSVCLVIGAVELCQAKSVADGNVKHANRLTGQSSPYLLQHAHNPVDWYPWGPEAFERAERQDKPIFLSIGYSTCHWCHVMERESFSSEKIAAIMNEHFISIKVDREQRPDIDQIYMNAVQMMTGSGGWPLSVFLTPQGRPFYGGTYFPPADRFGQVGFERLLLAVADAWQNRREQLLDSAASISNFLAASTKPGEKEKLSAKTLENAFKYYNNTFDAVYGGFGTAPKFPQPTDLMILLAYWQRTGEKKALEMVEKTLNAMAAGGFGAADTKQMLKSVRSRFLPNAVVLLHESGSAGSAIEKLVPFIKQQTTIDGKVTAYVCENYVCKRPISNVGELDKLIAAISCKK